MAKNISQILGAKNLSGVIQTVKGGLAEDLLPPAFLTPNRTVEGNHCTYRKVAGTRKTARIVQYGSPSQQRNLSGVSEVAATLLHTAENIQHDPNVLQNLLAIENETRQKLGQQEVARKTGEFKQLFLNLRVAAVFSLLANGIIWFNGDGELLPSSSGAVTTVDFGVPAANKNQLGGIIAASWATAGTPIHTHIAALRKYARKATGYRLDYAFYGEDILGYLWANTVLKEIINRFPAFQAAFSAGRVPNGLLDLNWVPIAEAFFNDKDGTNQDFFGGDAVVFTPTPSVDWFEFIEGTYATPSNLGTVSSDGVAAIGQVSVQQGMFSYAHLTADPVGIKQIAGDTFLPVLKVPEAIFIADVVA